MARLQAPPVRQSAKLDIKTSPQDKPEGMGAVYDKRHHARQRGIGRLHQMIELECVLLTGGASRRMGTDKASLIVGGEPMVERLARQLLSITPNVTLMGPHRVEGCRTVPDDHAHLGPLHALARFEPRASKVFVLACDVPLFDPRLVAMLNSQLQQEEDDAVVPLWQGTPQPLCALYRDRAFGELRLLSKLGENRLMPWLNQIAARYVPSESLAREGLDPRCVAGADTPEAFETLLQGEGFAGSDARS